MFKKIIGLLAFLGVVGMTSVASADDSGVYTKFDFKVGTSVPNLKVRVTPEFVFTNSADGLRQVVTRVGPSLKLADWVTVGANGFVAETSGRQDVRAEVQPDLKFKLGDFHFNDRNRLSYRALDSAAGDRVQYANELRVNIEDDKCPVVPFLSEEVFVGSGYGGVTQNRATGGVGYKFTEQSKVDVGYMLRSHNDNTPTWNQDHFLFLALASKF